MKEILKTFSNEILISLVTTLVGLVIILIRGLLKHIQAEIKRLLLQVELLRIDVRAMDYAIEKTDGNGYKNYRDTKKNSLINDNEFLNQEYNLE